VPELDPRLLRISIEINGQLKIYEGLAMTASGTKYANANQNECEVKITNLDQATRDYLLTETSPFNKNKTRKILLVEAGRVSQGYSLVFAGDITSAVGGQPPDITMTLKATTGDFAKGDIIFKDYNAALVRRVRTLNLDTGMIGIPEFTEQGIKVKMLFDNQTVLGGGLDVTSKLNPAANGVYTVYKLAFELASRDTPFYYIAEATRSAGG